jgi:plasmid stabilization system protein ParE
MKRKLIVQPRADCDRERHLLYLFEQAPQIVDRFDQAVQAAIERIRESPRGCATLDVVDLPGIELRFCRPHGFKNYLLIYQVTDDAIALLRILHSSQDFESALHE